MRYIGIASLLTCLSLPLTSLADDNLTIQLPPVHRPVAAAAGTGSGSPDSSDSSRTSGKSESRQFEDFLERKGATAKGRTLASRGGYPAGRPANHPGSSNAGTEKVVGRLGVIGLGAAIRGSRGSRRTLARVKPGTYIAINSEHGDWYGVLMSDHSTGWIAKSDVQILNYEVVTPKDYDPEPYRNYASNGGAVLLTGGQKAILDFAYTYLGVPYRWGGTSSDGLDCSAFVQRCFASQGIGLPRTAHEQIECGMTVPTDDLSAGDRVYFANKVGYISHTGIYVGSGYFIHSSSSHRGVAVSNLSDPLYRRMYAGARR